MCDKSLYKMMDENVRRGLSDDKAHSQRRRRLGRDVRHSRLDRGARALRRRRALHRNFDTGLIETGPTKAQARNNPKFSRAGVRPRFARSGA